MWDELKQMLQHGLEHQGRHLLFCFNLIGMTGDYMFQAMLLVLAGASCNFLGLWWCLTTKEAYKADVNSAVQVSALDALWHEHDQHFAVCKSGNFNKAATSFWSCLGG